MNINVQVSQAKLVDSPVRCCSSKNAQKTNTTGSVPTTTIDQKNLEQAIQSVDTKDTESSVKVSVSGENPNQIEMSGFLKQLSSMFESFISTLNKLVDKIVGMQTGSPQKPAVSSSPLVSDSNATPNPNPTKESFKDRTSNYLNVASNGEVSELKMQEAVVMYQLYQKDEEAESIFKTKLEEAKDKGISGQSAIKAALIETEKSGKIARWESDWVFSLSYRAAQLDYNLKDLKKENTDSSMPLELAVQTTERTLLSIATGVEIPVSKTVSSKAD